MQESNEQAAISTGDRRVERVDGGPVDVVEPEDRTVRTFILRAAHRLTRRMRGLDVVQRKPHLIPTIDRLEDPDILYTMALQEQKSNFTKDMNKFMDDFLPRLGLTKREIPAAELAKLQSGILLINKLFKEHVFTDKKVVSTFKKKEIEIKKEKNKRKRDESEEEEEDEEEEEAQEQSEEEERLTKKQKQSDSE